MFNLTNFISKNVVKRMQSMFADDVSLHTEMLSKKISGKSVLVIGGAGSIGSSFIRALLPYKPQSLVIVDINENALAELTRDLRSTYGVFIPVEYITYPMDYASSVFRKMFIAHGGFDIVANFSAHKHVRSEKDVFSVEAMLQNNVINAKKLLDLLVDFPPEEFFCVSTDKAANPVNIMGASKRIMEDLIFCYADKFPVKTARFANVAFSNGSLPAGFLARLAKLQPLSAPCDVKRYFVSPEESGQICLLAAILGNSREIFFPKFHESQMMTFDAIATSLLNTFGYKPDYCKSDEEAVLKASQIKVNSFIDRYPVHYSCSDTSGEKAFEEFYTDDENLDIDRFKSLGVIIGKKGRSKEELEKLFEELSVIFDKKNTCKDDVISVINKYLPNFNHIEMGKSLDGKM